MKIVKRHQQPRTAADHAATRATAERDESLRHRIEAAEQLGYLRGYVACLQTPVRTLTELAERLAATTDGDGQ